MIKIIILLTLSVALSSCYKKEETNVKIEKIIPSPMSQVDRELSSSAKAITNALDILSKTENIRTKSDSKINYVPTDLGALLSIDWVGPAEQAINKIAEYSSYKMIVMGTPSSITPAVSIHYTKTPLIKILRDISYQSRKYMDISVYEDEKVIELKYVFK